MGAQFTSILTVIGSVLTTPTIRKGLAKTFRISLGVLGKVGQRVPRGSIRPDGSVKHGKPMPKKLIRID